MNETNRHARDERLRTLLREGDPAADGSRLAPEEAGRMRRAVLTAVPERRRSFWLPVLAAAAAAALLLVVVLAFWRTRADLPAREPARRAAAAPGTPAAPGTAPPPSLRVSATPEVAPAAASSVESARTPAARPRSHRVRRAVRRATPAPVAPDPVQLASLPAPPVPEEETAEPGRQVQFSTPGGTRVIWVLSHESVVEGR